ncbi:MAG TPA: hypothetical protein VH208_01970, partial [Myxococcaceae bacterium]|nr:hypothetical protein [Myxococcaceae bacterium]
MAFLNDASLKRYQDVINKLPPDKQQDAIAALTRYTEAAGSAGNLDALNVGRQLLNSSAQKFPNSPCATEAAMAQAMYDQGVGDNKDAAELYKKIADPQVKDNLASKIADPQARHFFTARALFGLAGCKQAIATDSGDIHEARAAAAEITAMRARFEASGQPLNRDELAQLTAIEMRAYVGCKDDTQAQAALNHFGDTYGKDSPQGPAVPWVSDALKKFNQDYRKSGGAAAFENWLALQDRLTTGEKVSSMGIGAIAGGVVGFCLGGPPGAAGGAMVGAFAARRLYGMGKATWVGAPGSLQTGLTDQTALRATFNTAGMVMDLLPAVGLLNGAAKAGLPTLRILAGAEIGDGTEMAARMAQAMHGAEKAMGTEAFKALTQEQAEAAAKELMRQQLAQATGLGGKAAGALGTGMIGAQVGQYGVRLYQIESSNLPPEQKAAQLQQLTEEFAQFGAQVAGFVLLHKAAAGMGGTGVSSDVQAAIRQAVNAPRQVRVLSDAEYKQFVTAQGEAEIRALDKPTPEQVATLRQKYADLAQRGNMVTSPSYCRWKGTTYGEGSVFVSESGLKHPQAAARLEHELRQANFHALSSADRQA